jgi:hypothetical protein
MPAPAAAPFSYCVFSAGNNVESITTALARLGAGWRALDEKAVGASAEWAVTFVWKPTWSGARPVPAAQQWARGHALPGKRGVFSHWKAVEPLCEKPSFFECMREYYAAAGREYTERLPPTFIVQPLAGRSADAWAGWAEFSAARAAFAAQGEVLWLAKPADENRGIGIEVLRNEAEIVDFLASKGRAAMIGVKTHWVLQKYLEKPLLYKQRKFDCRVWAVLLDTGDVFLYAPGYVRTSSDVFDRADTSRFGHLTNYCQQVNSASFGAHEEGNTVRWETLEAWVTAIIADGAPLAGALAGAASGAEVLWGRGEAGVWGQIRACVREAIDALRLRGGTRTGGFEMNGIPRVAPPGVVPGGAGGAPRAQAPGAAGSRHTFELLGLDFLLTEDFKAYFIEVNTNPSLDHQAGWHGKFVDVMVDRLLALVLAHSVPEAPAAPPLPAGTEEADWFSAGDAAADADGARFRPAHGWGHVMNAFTTPSTVPLAAAAAGRAARGAPAAAAAAPAAAPAAAAGGTSPQRPKWRAHGPIVPPPVAAPDDGAGEGAPAAVGAAAAPAAPAAAGAAAPAQAAPAAAPRAARAAASRSQSGSSRSSDAPAAALAAPRAPATPPRRAPAPAPHDASPRRLAAPRELAPVSVVSIS